MIIVLDNIRSLNNVGSFFRTCDAFGVEELVLCGICGTPPDREIHKTALGAEESVSWSFVRETTAAVEKLHNRGYIVLAVEQVAGSVMLGDFTPDPSAKYALVFGNEVDGVSNEVVALCDGAIELPQVGVKRSLNVSVCGGAVIWHFFNLL